MTAGPGGAVTSAGAAVPWSARVVSTGRAVEPAVPSTLEALVVAVVLGGPARGRTGRRSVVLTGRASEVGASGTVPAVVARGPGRVVRSAGGSRPALLFPVMGGRGDRACVVVVRRGFLGPGLGRRRALVVIVEEGAGAGAATVGSVSAGTGAVVVGATVVGGAGRASEAT
ncbi:MAG: hypothetical protein ACRDZX_16160 [Acidimicrobiales bacterium]